MSDIAKYINSDKYSDDFKDTLLKVSSLSDRDKRMLYLISMDDEIPYREEMAIDRENVVELHNLLVQTVIDYINSHKDKMANLDAIYFNADALQESAKDGEWTCATDSYIRLEGIVHEKFTTKDGKEVEIPSRVKIGERY